MSLLQLCMCVRARCQGAFLWLLCLLVWFVPENASDHLFLQAKIPLLGQPKQHAHPFGTSYCDCSSKNPKPLEPFDVTFFQATTSKWKVSQVLWPFEYVELFAF